MAKRIRTTIASGLENTLKWFKNNPLTLPKWLYDMVSLQDSSLSPIFWGSYLNWDAHMILFVTTISLYMRRFDQKTSAKWMPAWHNIHVRLHTISYWSSCSTCVMANVHKWTGDQPKCLAFYFTIIHHKGFLVMGLLEGWGLSWKMCICVRPAEQHSSECFSD